MSKTTSLPHCVDGSNIADTVSPGYTHRLRAHKYGSIIADAFSAGSTPGEAIAAYESQQQKHEHEWAEEASTDDEEGDTGKGEEPCARTAAHGRWTTSDSQSIAGAAISSSKRKE
jgi:hypothetical protein